MIISICFFIMILVAAIGIVASVFQWRLQTQRIEKHRKEMQEKKRELCQMLNLSPQEFEQEYKMFEHRYEAWGKAYDAWNPLK